MLRRTAEALRLAVTAIAWTVGGCASLWAQTLVPTPPAAPQVSAPAAPPTSTPTAAAPLHAPAPPGLPPPPREFTAAELAALQSAMADRSASALPPPGHIAAFRDR